MSNAPHDPDPTTPNPDALSPSLVQLLIDAAHGAVDNLPDVDEPELRHHTHPVSHTVPMAAAMSADEIADSIRKGVDPWSIALNGKMPPRPSNLPVPTLLTARQLGVLFPTLEDSAKLFAAGRVSVFLVPEPHRLAQVVDTLPDVLMTTRQLVDAVGYKDVERTQCVAPRLIFSRMSKHGRGGLKPTDTKEAFAREIDDAIIEGDTVIAICSDISWLSDAGRAVMTGAHHWPPLTREMISALLKQTHSATGQIAGHAIVEILLAGSQFDTLPNPLICHAFRASSPLDVAAHLAKYATRERVASETLTLEDVKGLPDQCKTLDEMITDLRDWQAGKVAWCDVASSAILYGPPGAGKTMIAEAMAGSAGIAFVPTSYTDLQAAGHLGDYLKAMADVVAEAVLAAPCIIFFDELDSFGARSTGSDQRNARYMTSVINDLLQQLTRLNAAEGVIVLAATNFIDTLDPAILRSGRFDKKIAIPLPDKSGVRDILTHHIGAKDIQLGDSIVNRLLGLSGADIANVVRDAKARARRGRCAVAPEHLERATEAVTHGACEAREAHINRIATHEAGHIVMAACLGLPLPVKATASHAGGAVIRMAPATYTAQSAQDEMAYLMGGRSAEKIMFGAISSGSGADVSSDLDNATAIAIALEHQWGLGKSGLIFAPIHVSNRHAMAGHHRHAINEHLRTAEATAMQILTRNKVMLARVAEILQHKRELGAEEIVMLCNQLSDVTLLQRDQATITN